MKIIKLIEVRSELGAGTRGASLGIDALKLASLDYGSYYFGKFKTKEIRDSSHLLYRNPLRAYAKRIRGVIKIFNKLANAVQKEIKDGHFPVVLSGDHSSAGGTIAGVKMAYPDKKVGVIWIDAHADLHSPFTTPSGNIHGMPLASALGLGKTVSSKNPVKGDTIPYWEILKNLGGICPKITPDSLVFVGLRDYEKEEKDYIQKNNVRVVKVEEIRKGKIKEVADKITKNYLGHCDVLYVSFDIDALDAKLVPGTGTPVKHGLQVNETIKFLKEILKDQRLACFEVTEINPLLDKENSTAEKVFPIFREAINTIEKQKKKEKKVVKKIEKVVKKAIKGKKVTKIPRVKPGLKPKPKKKTSPKTKHGRRKAALKRKPIRIGKKRIEKVVKKVIKAKKGKKKTTLKKRKPAKTQKKKQVRNTKPGKGRKIGKKKLVRSPRKKAVGKPKSKKPTAKKRTSRKLSGPKKKIKRIAKKK
jgi:arginase